jgi:hypothetical protein
VLANTRWAARSASGIAASLPAGITAWSWLISTDCVTKSSAVLAFPQTPHALVVMKFLRSAGVTARPGRSSTSTMLPVPSWPAWPQLVPSQSLIEAMSSAA